MARRILALILIGGWLFQGAIPPHCHANMTASDMLAHGQRRHFHWSRSAHPHAACHGGLLCVVPLPSEHSSVALVSVWDDHDHDAVYVDGAAAGSVTADLPHSAPHVVALLESPADAPKPVLEQHLSAPPRYGGPGPPFLATTRLLL